MLYPRLRIAKDLFTDDGVIFISIDDTVAVILKGISPAKFALYRHNPEEFISKVIRLINEEKAIMIVDDITYNETDGTHDSSIFTAEKNKDFSRACLSKKNVQDYVFADGTAEKSIEQAKIKCAKKLFNDISGKDVVYEQVDSYQTLLNIMGNV